MVVQLLMRSIQLENYSVLLQLPLFFSLSLFMADGCRQPHLFGFQRSGDCVIRIPINYGP